MLKLERIILYSVLGVLFVLSLIFDLSITHALYAPTNWFGRIFEVAGELPVYLVGCTACCLIALHHPKDNVALHRFLLIFFLIAGAGVAVYGGHHTNKLLMRAYLLSYGSGAKIAVIGIIAACSFAICFLVARSVKPAQSREALMLGIFILAVIACSLLIMQGLKMIWLRPRYRTLVALQESGAIANADSLWRAFWEPQFFTAFKKYEVGGTLGFTEAQIKNTMSLLGITEWGKEEFYSFPSGHTMNSFLVVTVAYLPRVFPKLEKNKNMGLYFRLWFYFVAALVALSRIVRGAHNATDVVAGYLFATVIFDLGSHFLYERFLRQKIMPKIPSPQPQE